MFVPFQTLNDFYPGLFLWTDPTLYGRTVASALGAAGDRRLTSRDLRPCLVVGVDTANLTFTAAPLSATRPCNTEGWVRIDDVTPCITWKLNDAWIWVGTPPTLSMVFYEPKIMHPNKDMYYSVDPIASANLKSYWIQRKAYRRQSPTKGMESYSSYSTPTSSPSRSSASSSSPPPACFSPGPPRYTPSPPAYTSALSSPIQKPLAPGWTSPMAIATPIPVPAYPYQRATAAAAARPYDPSGAGTLSVSAVVVPPGFTESSPAFPGWWRDPRSGWFWSAATGLVDPASMSMSMPGRR
ncbi:hypothetical protein MKEN_00264800 [Mycena kentingensis (nom. inval.)]|nr:hypothetical protein MKEN_00264800 [Mycena kentingensis (nom. inval.)]